MPFGSFFAETKEPRAVIKKERPVKERKEKIPKPEPISPQPMIDEPSVDSIKLHIMLIGRNLSVLQEFLCSMNENMSATLHAEGLSYYTRELDAISDIVTKKKRLEQFFWTFSQNDWECAEDGVYEKTYTFTISPSGNQTKAIDLVMHCITPRSETRSSWDKTDAVWLVTDGLLLDEDRDCDPYLRFVQDTLEHIPQQRTKDSPKPICLILSQIERLGHYQTNGTKVQLPDSMNDQLRKLCDECFASVLRDTMNVAIFPVQTYGGMEYVTVDSKGDPVQRLSQNGFYQSYIPEGCQFPGLYTLQCIADSRGMNFFADEQDGGLVQKVRHICGIKLGDANWKPMRLQSEAKE